MYTKPGIAADGKIKSRVRQGLHQAFKACRWSAPISGEITATQRNGPYRALKETFRTILLCEKQGDLKRQPDKRDKSGLACETLVMARTFVSLYA
jgi:hypothetical protein